jgi:hypothetical protein
MDGDGQIPVVEIYRGVGIEDRQSFERIGLVKREIDRVHRMNGADELADYAGDARHPPEARMLAGARVEALCLGSKTWRDPYSHCSLLDQPGPGAAGAVAREQPLADLLE